MKNKKKITNKKKILKIVSICLTAVVVIGLTLFWGTYAYIITNKSPYNEGYQSYRGTTVIAHRGWSEKYFDNTVQAFNAAATGSFFGGIETDVRKTLDGVWVCSHDDNPFSDKNIKISKSKFNDIKDLPLDVSSAKTTANKAETYYLATYEDYIDICADNDKKALIEIKGSYSEEELAPVVEKAISKVGYRNTIFGSFAENSIANVLKHDYRVSALLFTQYRLVSSIYKEMNYSVGINRKIFSEKLLKSVHEKHNFLYVYNVNTKEEYNDLVKMQVDYVITDYKF